MTLNRIMVTAGITTLLQAAGQFVFAALAIAQHFCIIDFLRGLPFLIYIRVLYFHNPDSCGERVNIGESIDSIANQAFVLITELPMPVLRTFIINCVSLGLSVLWITASVVITMGGARDQQSKKMRWPWIIVTSAICALDLVATVTYANDTFHTRTLNDIMTFIGGVASGTSGAQLDTTWASWTMVLIYSRFVILFLVNIVLLILVIVTLNIRRTTKTDTVHAEAPAATPVSSRPVSIGVQPSPTPTPPPPITTIQETSERDEETGSIPSESPQMFIPRAGLSKSFRRMKNILFRKSVSPEVHRRRSNSDILEMSQTDLSSRTQHIDMDKKRTVNFPATLIPLQQRQQNIIAEQDKTVIDTSGRVSPPRISQSMPHLATTPTQPEGHGRRGTTVGLQGQLPWAYIPAPAHRMRDQLPPDEDLPPVPLPDYTAFQSVRKASVHRATSSISSLTLNKKDYTTLQSTRSPLIQSDVLY